MHSTMDCQAVISKLNDILRHEWTGVAQYSQAGFMVEGIWREVYADKFFDSAKESFQHAKLVGEKIVALGGVPSVERNPVQQSKDVKELLEFGLQFEAKAVQLYCEALDLAEGDRPLVIFLEDILKEEQEGVDELTKILREFKTIASTSRDAMQQAG
jgi:bacterioferritin